MIDRYLRGVLGGEGVKHCLTPVWRGLLSSRPRKPRLVVNAGRVNTGGIGASRGHREVQVRRRSHLDRLCPPNSRQRPGAREIPINHLNVPRDLTPLFAPSSVAVLGASNGWAQALSSLVKLPLLFLATLTICLPTLYLFNLVFGARLSMMQAVTLILVSVTVTSVLTLAFAPISLFFLISAHNYSFFKLLNVCILALTALVGLRFLTEGMRALNVHQLRLQAQVAAQPAPVEVVPEPVAAAVVPNGGTTPVSRALPPIPVAPGRRMRWCGSATRFSPSPVPPIPRARRPPRSSSTPATTSSRSLTTSRH